MTPNLKAIICAAMFTATLLALLPTQAQTTNADFQQAVTAYQQSPSVATAEKVIKLAAALDQLPPIPEEARRHYVKACTLFDDAKQTSDSLDAAKEFRQALLVAPWWGEAYMKMGLALETAERYDDAIAALKLFMATKPQDEVLRKTQDEIYKIEAKAEKAAKEAAAASEAKAKESSPETVAAKQQNTFEDLLKKIDGRRYACPGGYEGAITIIDVKGSVFVWGAIKNGRYTESPGDQRVEIRARETEAVKTTHISDNINWKYDNTYIISEDGDRITVRGRVNDGDVHEFIYLWQR
jgi:tetratricopeptide (TPR) repeat protein